MALFFPKLPIAQKHQKPENSEIKLIWTLKSAIVCICSYLNKLLKYCTHNCVKFNEIWAFAVFYGPDPIWKSYATNWGWKSK